MTSIADHALELKLKDARQARKELLGLMESLNVALRSPAFEFSWTERKALELTGAIASDRLKAIPCDNEIVRELWERPA